MRDFPRPKKVEVTIFGTAHEMHRLSYVEFTELLPEIVSHITPVNGTVSGQQVLDAILPAADKLLKCAFPTFTEWEQLPVDYALELIDVISEENDIPGMITNFSKKIQAGIGGLSLKI